MSKTFKIALILLVIVSVVSAVVAVFAFIGKEREYTKRLLLEDKLAATLKDKRRLEKDIETNKKAKEEMESKIKEAELKVKELSSQIEDAEEKNKTVLLDLSAKEEKIAGLKQELDKEKKEKLSISKKLEDLEFDYTRAKADAAKLKDEKLELEKRISDLKEKSVDLDKIVVNPSEGSVPQEEKKPVKELLRGRVLVVNRDYSFIVADLGQDDGIEKGMIFEVRDGVEFLGKAEIDKVYDTMASATILSGGAVDRMKKGDLIIESR